MRGSISGSGQAPPGHPPTVVNINDVLQRHVVLDILCVDRLYVNADVGSARASARVRAANGYLGPELARDVGGLVMSPLPRSFRMSESRTHLLTRERGTRWRQ
jgi:hypothetical protein